MSSLLSCIPFRTDPKSDKQPSDLTTHSLLNHFLKNSKACCRALHSYSRMLACQPACADDQPKKAGLHSEEADRTSSHQPRPARPPARLASDHIRHAKCSAQGWSKTDQAVPSASRPRHARKSATPFSPLGIQNHRVGPPLHQTQTSI